MEPKVIYLDSTQYPEETVCALWDASRSNKEILVPAKLHELAEMYTHVKKKVRETFRMCYDMSLPLIECISFTFLLEGVSISFREQMVRHRIGVKVGERIGCDMFPDVHDSSWWSQSMRILDMGSFATEGRYRVPESVLAADEPTRIAYRETMLHIERVYSDMVANGVPMEDAREIIPLGATHRISWTLNLAALKHIIGKRSCWMLQLGVWGPIIQGMVSELTANVGDAFSTIARPPCMQKGSVGTCHYDLDNKSRLTGEAEIPPCPLWLQQLGIPGNEPDWVWQVSTDGRSYADWVSKDPIRTKRMASMQESYSKLWSMNLGASGRVPIANIKGCGHLPGCAPEEG